MYFFHFLAAMMINKLFAGHQKEPYINFIVETFTNPQQQQKTYKTYISDSWIHGIILSLLLNEWYCYLRRQWLGETPDDAGLKMLTGF